ncbi:uncharacterized protein LOC143265001 [Megachile rotundata]|uniref:uncharacterized protein LOC143265001 n=1 Tax=Megachile rotundata TaxID=143995 RepID=UPI003FD10327
MVERWHRSLKTAIMCHAKSNWVEILPTVLLGLRSSFKEDIGATAAELLYGVPLRLPGEFFIDTQDTDNFYLDKFRDQMRQIRPRQTAHHSRRVDAVKRPLEQPYEGPFKVLQRVTDITYLIDYKGNPIVFSTERLKPAFVELERQNETQPKTYSRLESSAFPDRSSDLEGGSVATPASGVKAQRRVHFRA